MLVVFVPIFKSYALLLCASVYRSSIFQNFSKFIILVPFKGSMQFPSIKTMSKQCLTGIFLNAITMYVIENLINVVRLKNSLKPTDDNFHESSFLRTLYLPLIFFRKICKFRNIYHSTEKCKLKKLKNY